MKAFIEFGLLTTKEGFIMSDPKYTFCPEGIRHIDGYVLPSDEPIMVFRGKDIGSLEAILAYLEMLEDQEQNEVIVSHYVSSIERLRAFYEYQRDNPYLQSIGCSRSAHIDYSYIMVKARKKLDEIDEL